MHIIFNVDDCETNRLIVRAILESCCEEMNKSYVILDVGNGEEAVNQYKICVENGYEVCYIIMDYMMPKKNGAEAVKEIKELGYKNTVIILTALDSNEVEENEADHVIEKPFTYAKAKQILKSCCCDDCEIKDTCKINEE